MNSWSIWRGETKALDDAARLGAEGSFVRLGSGFTHFEAAGDPADRPVILVHGFSVPYFIWDTTFGALAAAGMRPIRYDLYGRGLSDRPNVAYDMPLFVQQLGDLLDTLEVPTADLIGLSMGGPIAAAFTVSYPHRVRRLGLIDPSGARTIRLGVLYRIAILPGISDVLFGMAGGNYLLRSVGRDFFEPGLVEAFREQYRVQMAYRGFRRSILSTVRNGMLGGFARLYQELDLKAKPTLIIWGENDRTVPFDESRTMLGLLPHAEFRPISGCGHIPHYERPEVVNPLLIDFLS